MTVAPRARVFSSFTCGASDGIGYGVAKAFLEAGADVSITGTRTADAYDNDFSGMQFHTLDIQDPAMITELATKFDSLDVLRQIGAFPPG